MTTEIIVDGGRFPTAFGMFNVYVPAKGITPEDAKQTVKNYLYNGMFAQGVRIDENHNRFFIVAVLAMTYGTPGRLEFDINYQRDRLMSAMYGSSEPIFYRPRCDMALCVHGYESYLCRDEQTQEVRDAVDTAFDLAYRCARDLLGTSTFPNLDAVEDYATYVARVVAKYDGDLSYINLPNEIANWEDERGN